MHGSSDIVGATRVHYTWFPKSYGLYLSHTTASTYATTSNIVHCWPSKIGSCCVCLHIALRKQFLLSQGICIVAAHESELHLFVAVYNAEFVIFRVEFF